MGFKSLVNGVQKTGLRFPPLRTAVDSERLIRIVQDLRSRASGMDAVLLSEVDRELLRNRLISAANSGTLDSIKARDWSRSPSVFWYRDGAVAGVEEIVEGFFRRAILRGSPRWILRLIYEYLASFDRSSRPPSIVLDRLKQTLESGRWQALDMWKERQRKWSIFDQVSGPIAVGDYLLTATSVDSAFEALGLTGSIVHGPEFQFLSASYVSAMGSVREDLQTGRRSPSPIVDRVIEWSSPVVKASPGVRYHRHIGLLANSLLLPWASRTPEPSVKEQIKRFLIHRVGDPRIQRGAWQPVDPAATAVMLHWLTGDTLRQFFDILSRTADEIWEYRKKFWMAFYEMGAITDAYFALGRSAEVLAQRVRHNIPSLSYASLVGAQPDQSVLVMRLADFTIAEWTHDGKCRFWMSSMNSAPRLYQKSYLAGDLRNGAEFEQAHHGSATGTWQSKIAEHIRRRSGIYVPQSAWR